MAKSKTVYFCQSCGTQSAKWMGRCPSCNEWNTILEEVISGSQSKAYSWENGKSSKGSKTRLPVRLNDIEGSDEVRITTASKELDRVLGGGIVHGSLVLIGGEPGIGKSTLLLQVALSMRDRKVLYVSGEESEQQIKSRAARLGKKGTECYVLTETHTQSIFSQIKSLNPGLVIIDSIQTLHSEMIDAIPGSVSQIRQCTGELQKFAKETGTPVFLVGHITKDGALAGPKVLEHIVDTVLQFEGERNYNYRILRTVKNRFGSTSELGIYEMRPKGLREVSNPSEILISERDEPISGIAIAAMIEGMRPMLIEVQALVATAVYGTPQRSSTGFDLRRLHMILAVLEKRCGFQFGTKDVFLNIAGGIRVDDPAIDMAIVAALISSLEDEPVQLNVCFAGEVGLSGEIRAVSRIEQRLFEADRLGLDKIFFAKSNTKGLNTGQYHAELMPIGKVDELNSRLFPRN